MSPDAAATLPHVNRIPFPTLKEKQDVIQSVRVCVLVFGVLVSQGVSWHVILGARKEAGLPIVFSDYTSHIPDIRDEDSSAYRIYIRAFPFTHFWWHWKQSENHVKHTPLPPAEWWTQTGHRWCWGIGEHHQNLVKQPCWYSVRPHQRLQFKVEVFHLMHWQTSLSTVYIFSTS